MALTQHIDSIIQISIGVAFTWMGFGGRSRLPARAVKVFRICGPALIAIGAVLLWKPQPAAHWQRLFTSDKIASAEFPGAATPKESTDTVGAVTVKRTTLTYDVPGKDIALFLSYSAIPKEARGLSDAQRIENTLAYLATQGSQVVKNETIPGPPIVHRITMRSDANKTSMQMALSYVGESVYRVVASWADGNEDRALIDRFVTSFKVAPGTAPCCATP